MRVVQRAPASADERMPLPARQMNLYLTFWHIVYLGLLVFLTYESWATLGGHDPGRAAALTLLALVQAGLYLWNFIFNEMWPLPRWRITVYFAASIALWLIEWWLNSDWQWFGLAYFGQMMGTLPPIAAVPGSFVIYVLVVLITPDFHLAETSLLSARLFSPLVGYVAAMVFYLFVYYITQTSEARGQLLAELRTAQAQLEAARARDAELAALQERERLARDLHDSLGHALVAISVQLEAIQRLYRVDPERASAQVDTLKTATRTAMDELRRSLAGLRAPGLGEQALPDALRSLAIATAQANNFEVACHVAGDAARLSPAVAEVFWRVAQEALTNVARHAQARRVALDLTIAPATAVLRVQDDGRGLAPGAEDQPGHYGLLGLRERVEGVAGTFTLTSAPTGLTVEASVPLLPAHLPNPAGAEPANAEGGAA
jgi:signal transduction histidine kinase